MRYFLEISYRGTHYHGWQYQKNANTLQEEIEKMLATILLNEVKITGASRTDTGVHALQNFAHFDYDNPLPAHLLYKMNCVLPGDISIKNIFQVKSTSHARFDAISRTYRYVIHTEKNPFLQGLSYFYPMELNIQLLNQIAKELFSYEDFTSFSKKHSQTKTNICHIKNAEWKKEGELYVFYIQADRFLWGMVRAIVGTMLIFGEGKKSISEFSKIISANDRNKAGTSVPAEGLFLSQVEYPGEIFLLI